MSMEGALCASKSTAFLCIIKYVDSVNTGIKVENMLSKELACVKHQQKSNFVGRNRCDIRQCIICLYV